MSFASSHGHGFITYLWHYVLARLLYDDLVRPLIHAPGAMALAVVGACAAVVLLRKRRRSRR
jgi:hypothetical protein